MGLLQEARKTQTNSLTFIPKGTRNRTTNKALSNRRKEIIKIRAEINDIET